MPISINGANKCIENDDINCQNKMKSKWYLKHYNYGKFNQELQLAYPNTFKS